MPIILTMIAVGPLRHVLVDHVMGTVVSLDARGVDARRAQAAFARLAAWLHEVDLRFSTYREDSEIRRIDAGRLVVEAASADVRFVLDRCRELRRRTGGAFDEYAAGPLDPSAFVKGWAAERGADILQSEGLEDFSLNLGGDVVLRGGALPRPTWRIGIQHPHDREAIAATIAVTDTAVATSGLYERGAHLLDPRSGEAPVGVVSVTVVGPDLGMADAYSTAAFAMGLGGPQWTLALDGFEAMTIFADDQVLTTPGFPTDEISA